MKDSTRDTALAAADELFESGHFLQDLERRIGFPTESQVKERRPVLFNYLSGEIAPWLQARGYQCAIFDNPSPKGGPLLVAQRHEGDELPTLLTYGHGDVVQGFPEEWAQGLSPWKLVRRNGKLYGRGTADNKGQHSIVLSALDVVLSQRGCHGFNSKILIEMSEEVGSPGLDTFCQEHRELLKADFLLASDGPRLKMGEPDMKLGNRGTLSFDLVVRLRDRTRHSGHWGGVLEDPVVLLTHALTSIVDRSGKILVPEWRPKHLSPTIREMVSHCRLEPGPDFPQVNEAWGEPGLSQEEKMFAWTSFVVLAMKAGHPENPTNDVAASAFARCQLRFTADIDQAEIIPALQRHLAAHGHRQVEVVAYSERFREAARSQMDSPWIGWASESIRRTTGKFPIVVPNSAGSLPSDVFIRHLGVPTLWVPHSYAGCQQHGPDEHLLEPIVREGLRIMTGLFWDLAEVRHA